MEIKGTQKGPQVHSGEKECMWVQCVNTEQQSVCVRVTAGRGSVAQAAAYSLEEAIR